MEEAGGRTICTLWDEGKSILLIWKNGFVRPDLAAALSVSAKSKYKVSVERGKTMKKSFLFTGRRCPASGGGVRCFCEIG
ncbi:MAG: hypothetical protein ACLUIQ_03095 [Dialister invisus]